MDTEWVEFHCLDAIGFVAGQFEQFAGMDLLGLRQSVDSGCSSWKSVFDDLGVESRAFGIEPALSGSQVAGIDVLSVQLLRRKRADHMHYVGGRVPCVRLYSRGSGSEYRSLLY